jgi:ATP-dependent Lon protease
MQESVRTALSWVRSHAHDLGLDGPAASALPSAAHAALPPPPSPPRLGITSPALMRHVGAPSFGTLDVHVHFPAGAIRKDGPSAGSATLVALVSLVTGRLARSDTAMSGEISLRGHLLPVGGIREKALAAHRAGLSRVLLPAANEKDAAELPKAVRDQLAIVWCETVEDLLEQALLPAGAAEEDDLRLPTAPTGGTGTLALAPHARPQSKL